MVSFTEVVPTKRTATGQPQSPVATGSAAAVDSTEVKQQSHAKPTAKGGIANYTNPPADLSA